NIAGRGVDIILGGTPFNAELAEEVKKLGGLHVLGTERHESRRIDNQLRGRSGRQGDPGSSQFFVSLEDDLIRLFGGERVKQMMTTLGVPDDMPIEHGLVSRVIESAQKKIEGLNFDVRKHVLEFDDVMNKHREVVYRVRNRVLDVKTNLKQEILAKIYKEIENVIISNTAGSQSEWNLKEIYETLTSIFPFERDSAQKFDAPQVYIDHYTKLAREIYEAREKKFGEPAARQIEKLVMLQSIDSLWMEHLDTMDHLRDSVRLRGYAQRDPLIEYKREGFQMFQRLLSEIDKAIVYTIYKVELTNAPQARQPQPMVFNNSSPQGMSGEPAKKIGRNDPCPCGSGKKYKKCHGVNV
ncbi:MAG: SEC-C metal-binding domain-containing protein, partial [Patescibacteria group bacterium]